MNLQDIEPVQIGIYYIARVKKFPRDMYLATTSKGNIIEVGIKLADQFDTLQEIKDIAYAYKMNNHYFK